MSTARKSFLAGSNQLTAIKNWLKAGGITESKGSNTTLTDLGLLMAAQDTRAEMAWTWWLFHLHLCVNPDAFPYTGFFHTYDTEGRWLAQDEVANSLYQKVEDGEGRKVFLNEDDRLSKDTVETYFSGVAQTFEVGGFVNELGLVEERTIGDGRSSRKVRRRLTKPEDLLVAYGAVLFQRQHFPNQPTVHAREILGKGFARVFGLRESDVRESLSRITTHKDYGQYVQYHQNVNLDSIQFLRPAEAAAALRDLRLIGYRSQVVKWQ
jgi:hypothetical protein